MGNILIVDDERSIRFTVKAFLEAEGHRVQTAEEAESAMALVRSTDFDVILSDIVLPGISGVDLLRKIREASPHAQVIMMTGEPTLETASDSLRLGAVDYLRKPVGKSEILKAVRNALHVKDLDDERVRLEEENKRYTDHLEHLVASRTRDLSASEAALRRRAEELAILNRLARRVNESITVDEAIQCGLKEVVHAVLPDLALLFLVEEDHLVLKGRFPEWSEAAWQPEDVHEVGQCLCGMAISGGKAVYSSDIRVDPRCTMRECRDAGFRSFAALPLRCGSEILGVMGIASSRERDFGEYGDFFDALANEMSIGLHKSLLYEQVQEHAAELKLSLSRIEEAEAERMELQHHLQRSQKLEALGTLAAGIAHDFNNILGAMIGYAELALLNTPAGSRAKDNLGMVLTAGERAKDLVKQILAFSRQSDEERKPIQLTHIVNEVLKFMRASLPTTIEIRKSIGPHIGIIMADPVQIHQVLMNLCTNAHHAMGRQGGVLEVQVTGVDVGPKDGGVLTDLKPGPHVRVTVKDTGHGMDASTLARIFDPYFTTKEKGVGTGLGLAVVHGIVQKYGGWIAVQSEPGNGTLFELFFPVSQTEHIADRPVSEDLPTGHERILLVDDDQLHLEVIQRTLEYLGYHVEAKTSSLDALSLFRTDPHGYDLVVTDMTMPAMTGDRLAAELIQLRSDIPIVLCTGYTEKMMEENARAMGIRAFVMKPVLIGQMARAVRDALDNRMDDKTIAASRMADGRAWEAVPK